MREEISSRAKTSLYQAVNMLISGVKREPIWTDSFLEPTSGGYFSNCKLA